MRKVGAMSDSVFISLTQAGRFEALSDSPAAAEPATPGADHQGRHAAPWVDAQFDLTQGDSKDASVQDDGEILTESDTESCGEVERQRLARVRQQLMQDGRRGVPGDGQMGAGSGIIVRGSGPTGPRIPTGVPLPPAIRRQRWPPVMVPLWWTAAGAEQSSPMVEWFVSTPSSIPEPVQFHGGQDPTSDSLGGAVTRDSLAAARARDAPPAMFHSAAQAWRRR